MFNNHLLDRLYYGLWIFIICNLLVMLIISVIRYPIPVASSDMMTITTRDGITLQTYGQLRMPDYDLLMVIIVNRSDTPFDTTAFRFDSQPLPDLPNYRRPWMADITPLPATVPPYDLADGYLYLRHPDNSSEPWPPLLHPRGPLVIPLVHD